MSGTGDVTGRDSTEISKSPGGLAETGPLGPNLVSTDLADGTETCPEISTKV